MSPYKQSRCRAPECRRPIFWAPTERRKKMPLDERELTPEQLADDPTHAYFVDDEGTAIPWEPVLAHVPDETGPVYRSHFRTCPAADRFAGGASR